MPRGIFWYAVSFSGESGLREVGLCGIHPLTRRYNAGMILKPYGQLFCYHSTNCSYHLKALIVEKKIFYSWQSDLPNKSNRGFISDALEKAIKQLKADDSFAMTPFLDRDTQDELGSPDIVHTIFNKIEGSDVFVCDISFINSGLKGTTRLVPNPNVILELGYAIGTLGWKKIILVMNTHFGGAEHLPFDLRGRRVLTYHLDPESVNKAEVRNKVSSIFTESIKGILNHFASPELTRNTPSDTMRNNEPELEDEYESRVGAMLDTISSLPYLEDRSKALSGAVEKLIDKGDLDNAYRFAEEIPYLEDKSKALSRIAEMSISQNKFSLAQKVAKQIPYLEDKNKMLAKVASAIAL
ncbi:nucleotide-binding protein [Vibrio sp. IRLE0018]|uniref:TIR domain-containing protein n=1 Tax=Vibrio floridensis TaxID=2908007 RepID=UPI001F189000|nr:TIR domain-containing protein [Vibrio floridensis]MCF8781192.1 nucleotide-binding protein [Vibrio floridensis]